MWRRVRIANRVLVRKPERKRILERPSHRWKDLQEIGCESMDWIYLSQLAGSCECRNEPSGSIKYGEFLN
jgi:hypothetical protein